MCMVYVFANTSTVHLYSISTNANTFIFLTKGFDAVYS